MIKPLKPEARIVFEDELWITLVCAALYPRDMVQPFLFCQHNIINNVRIFGIYESIIITISM